MTDQATEFEELPEEGSPLEAKANDDPDEDVPEWAAAHLPAVLKIPPQRRPIFLRFKSAWTDEPSKGVEVSWPRFVPGQHDEAGRPLVVHEPHLTRVLVLWSLSDAEERMALKRAAGDRSGVIIESTKQMIRAVDGKPVDWTSRGWGKGKMEGEAYNPHRLWTELGAKCRGPLQNIYLKAHALNDGEMADFLLHGVRVTTVVAG